MRTDREIFCLKFEFLKRSCSGRRTRVEAKSARARARLCELAFDRLYDSRNTVGVASVSTSSSTKAVFSPKKSFPSFQIFGKHENVKPIRSFSPENVKPMVFAKIFSAEVSGSIRASPIFRVDGRYRSILGRTLKNYSLNFIHKLKRLHKKSWAVQYAIFQS